MEEPADLFFALMVPMGNFKGNQCGAQYAIRRMWIVRQNPKLHIKNNWLAVCAMLWIENRLQNSLQNFHKFAKYERVDRK